MNWFFYNLGNSIREAGERAWHKRRWFAGAVIYAGYFIREIAMKESARNSMRKRGMR